MRTHFLYFGFIGTVLATCATPGATQTMNIPNRNVPTSDVSPISVQSCDVDAIAGNALLAKTGRLTIAFANDGSIVADLIRFRVTFAGHEATVRDTGRFAPGVTIRHNFRDTAGYYGSPLFGTSPRCTVDSVHFVDGTTWLAHGQFASVELTNSPNAASSTAPSAASTITPISEPSATTIAAQIQITSNVAAQCSAASALVSYRSPSRSLNI